MGQRHSTGKEIVIRTFIAVKLNLHKTPHRLCEVEENPRSCLLALPDNCFRLLLHFRPTNAGCVAVKESGPKWGLRCDAHLIRNVRGTVSSVYGPRKS